MQEFGGPVRLYDRDAEDGTSSTTATEDMERVRQLLSGLDGSGEGSLRIYRPQPTAAFSPRDTTHAAYEPAMEAMRALSFAPIERRAGGQLAVYDQNCLVIDLVTHHADPRNDVTARFRHFAGAIAAALRSFGVDARVGAIPGEYCPGDYSINLAGRIKIAGIAQRIGRQGYHLGAVIGVVASPGVKKAVAEAYRMLGYDFDPETFGAICDLMPDVNFAALRKALLDATALGSLIEVLPLNG